MTRRLYILKKTKSSTHTRPFGPPDFPHLSFLFWANHAWALKRRFVCVFFNGFCTFFLLNNNFKKIEVKKY